ncbi:leucine-rich repeat-containing protein 27 isoform X3 [Bubalus bubalis]|uniref:leucine-rich repeat-containing protein 27 isoform X3 n=1 Tax=Bubalus bubalis TaxID=89462 RepID=UPI001E1B6FF9|nr:leucine-rich repeat-containing protein 27 isoform X3 [Bubalus bubalis]
MPFLCRLTSLAGGRCAADSPLKSSFCFSSSWARSVCSFLTWVPTSAGHPGFASLLVSSSLGSLVPAPAPPSLPNYLLRTLEAAASGRGAAAYRDPPNSPTTAEVTPHPGGCAVVPRGVLPPGGLMEGSGSLSVPCGAGDRESQAGSKPASASRDVHQGVIFSSSAILDLSQSGLHHFGEIFKVPNLKQLHLQRNALCTIPKDFFQLLPNLSWLDLRFNRITALPSGIGCHKHLKTLLLERNPIRMLPVELGGVTTLKALSLRHCPLEFPPPLVVQRGLVAILTFLQICAADHAAPHDGFPRVKKMTIRDLPQPLLDLSEEHVPNKETIHSQEPKGSMVTEKADFFPPVETLDPHEPRRSPEPPEDWPSEEEIQRFWKLRQEIVENERAGALGNQLLPAELPPSLRAALSSRGKPLPRPRPLCRMKIPSFQGVLPELDSTRQALVRTSQLGESRGLVLQELRERQAQEQSKRDKRALQEWRESTQVMKRRQEEPESLPAPPTRRNPVRGGGRGGEGVPAEEPGGSKDCLCHGPEREQEDTEEFAWKSDTKQGEAAVSMSGDEVRSLVGNRAGLRGQILEETLKPQAQQLHARRSRFRGLAPLKDVGRAARDAEMAQRLHDEVLKLKLRSALNRNHQCAALPRSLLLRPAVSRPQNIFFNPKY